MVVLCEHLGSNKIISLYTSCTHNVVCYFDHEINIEFGRSSETSAILGITGYSYGVFFIMSKQTLAHYSCTLTLRRLKCLLV